jgi:hypothetical protein
MANEQWPMENSVAAELRKRRGPMIETRRAALICHFSLFIFQLRLTDAVMPSN